MHETLLLLNINSLLAVAPSFAGVWWAGIVLGILLLALFLLYLSRKHLEHLKKQKAAGNNSWNDYFVNPPEYTDAKPENDKKVDVLQETVQKQNAGTLSTKNFFLWDDGLIFCGFRLQGIDLRTANLYGAYLRDMHLRDRGLDRRMQPMIFRDAEAYKAIDMSSTFLKNDILVNGADLGRVDLSGLYLRDVGLQGIDIGNILKAEESKFGDCFLPESYQKDE